MGVYAITLDRTSLVNNQKTVTKSLKKPKTDVLKDEELSVNVNNAVNLLPINEAVDNKLQKYLEQWKTRFDFHYVDVYFEVRSFEREHARGVKQVDFTYKITDGKNKAKGIKILDIAPKTKWIPKNYSVSLSGSTGGGSKIGFKGKITDNVNVDVNAKVNGSVSFDYKWNPKVAAVKSSSTYFIANNFDNKFLDGRVLMTLLIQRDRKIKEMLLKVRGKILFDIGRIKSDIYGTIDEPIIEDIIFNPSQVLKTKSKNK